MKTPTTRMVLLTLMLVVTGVSAMASSLSETFSFAVTPTPFSTASNTIPQFNPTLGTLTSIVIDASGSTSGTATITNGTTSSGTYDFTSTATLLLEDPTLAPLFSVTPDFTGSLLVPSKTTLTSSSFTGSTVTGSDTLTSGFGPYTGTGSYVFTLNGTSTAIASGPSPFSVTIDSSAGETGSVTYNYTAAVPPTIIPEPSSIVLFGSGLTILAMILKRRAA